MPTLTGSVDRVVFQSLEDGFAVAHLRLEDIEDQRTYDDLTTIVGSLGRIAPGELLRVGGEWERHPKHGRRFRVQWLEQKLPATVAGIGRFLGCGIIKGVGPATAEQIVTHFGAETIDVIENHPDRLREVPKLNRKRAELVVQGWRDHRQIRELMLFLQSHNLPGYFAKRLQDQYGDQAVAVLQRDPYQLVQEVYGIGFKTADGMAIKLGLSPVSISRLVAGVAYVLGEATHEGHVYLPKQLLLERAAKLLSTNAQQLEPAVLEASRQGLVVFDGDTVYRAALYYAERGVASGLQRLQLAPSLTSERKPTDPVMTARRTMASLGISLADKQMDAVVMALREKVGIITGGPGTGKTMCLHVVISALEAAGIPYRLCAPTGRAAKRMTAATGRPASTIHRLLGYQPATNDFGWNDHHQLDPQMVIVDETSMLDVLLFNQLLRAIPDEGHLLLVGDSDQLPAVGAGDVLRDLLASGTVPSVTLEELFRQGQDSRITRVAHQIKRGELPRGTSGGDLYLVRVSDAEGAQAVIKEMVVRRIPARFGFNTMRDIQVLSPTHRGPAGVSALNTALQALLNPEGAPTRSGASSSGIRLGDKVMQVRNNYDKEVYNGDIGIVTHVDVEAQALSVRFGDVDEHRDVDYEFSDLPELVLAYALSVHKSQGSEFPCVVLPLLTSHYPLLQRNLLYTALTRARRLCILVYQIKALAMAVSAQHHERRYTGLSERLKSQTVREVCELGEAPLDPEPSR